VLDGVEEASQERVAVVLRVPGRVGCGPPRHPGRLRLSDLIEGGGDRRLGDHHRLARVHRGGGTARGRRPRPLEGVGDLAHPAVHLQAAPCVALQVVLDARDGGAELGPRRPVRLEHTAQPQRQLVDLVVDLDRRP